MGPLCLLSLLPLEDLSPDMLQVSRGQIEKHLRIYDEQSQQPLRRLLGGEQEERVTACQGCHQVSFRSILTRWKASVASSVSYAKPAFKGALRESGTKYSEHQCGAQHTVGVQHMGLWGWAGPLSVTSWRGAGS